MRETFVLPNVTSLLENPNNDKIVVVSIIGKTALNTYGLKIKSIGRMFSSEYNRLAKEYLIEGYHDEENQIIYLHIYSLLDTNALLETYMDISKRSQESRHSDDFLSVYDEVKSSFAKLFLFALHVSHVVVLSHPGSTFDLNYIQYFKAMDTLRKDLHVDITEALKEVPSLSPEWISTGRPCTPRLIFYFERCPKNVTNLKKLEHNTEDRIYQILRKVRIVSNNSTTSLFAIPLNDEFVYMSTEKPPDRLGDSVRNFIRSCLPRTTVQVNFPFCSQPDEDHSFSKFLDVYVQQARNKGFDDCVSSRHAHQPTTHFELPYVKQWAEVCVKMYEVIMKHGVVSPLCTDTRFSEQRCLKVLPLAFARYQENLPTHYPRAVHETKQGIALALFGAQARGPIFQEYSEQLIADCQAHWENGRQLCEAASLTGNPCTLPKHSSEQEHCSGVRYVAACDCGRKQGSREDPYNAKQANYTYYQQLAKECMCSTLERINFPVFQPSTKEYKAATLTDSEETLSASSDRSNDLTPDLERGLVRQPSTTEYLPGMLTLSSPPGLLPHFPSWSLVCLGPSSLYSHNLGLSENHHPGFLNSTNYLLPWDVMVYPKTKSVGQQCPKQVVRGGRRSNRSNTSLPLYTVKVFIGVEYECPRGHRFMLAAPDRVLRAAPGSIVKDTGRKIAESDMPLYFNCPCRSGKQRVAQLMRLHIVTPKAPVHVTIDPKVQPAAGAPIFVSSVDGPTNLSQSAYWVMRFPYIYVSDKEHFYENNAARLLQGVFGVVKIE